MSEHHCTDTVLHWDLAEGKHIGTLIEFGEYSQPTRSGGKKTCFRLVFEVESNDPGKEFRAQKRYPLNDKLPGALEKDLARWLGKKAMLEQPTVRLKDLAGRKATLTIKHLHGHGHKKPFALVKAIGPVHRPKPSTQATLPAPA